MAANDRAIGYLELNSKQWDDALAAAGKTLVAFGAALASYKVADFLKEGVQEAIKFGNEAYLAAQKLNGFDPGNLLIAQKALQAAGMSAEEARGNIEEFGRAGRPLEQLFKGGSAGFADALTRSSKEFGTQAAVLSKSAEEFAFVQNQLNNVGTKLQGFFLGLADKIAQPLSDLLAELDKVDLVGMGERFGSSVATAINVVKGLIQNKSLFEALGLSVKVGFEIAIDYLSSPGTWAGIVKVAVGALALIGNFLATIFLGIGKLLVATIETAFERLREKYGALITLISPAAGLANAFGAHASTDFGTNLKSIENNSGIKDQEAGAGAINAKALSVALSGINDLLKSSKGANFSSGDAQKLEKLFAEANAAGLASAGTPGKTNPVFSEKADPFHVIADSLARVGGGGRYVRTGLSIAEKAAMDSARFNKQQVDLQAKYLPFLKSASSPNRLGVTSG